MIKRFRFYYLVAAGSLLAVACLSAVAGAISFLAENATETSCATINFGQVEYRSTASFSNHSDCFSSDLAVAAPTTTGSLYADSHGTDASSWSSLRIGNVSTTGSITFTFSSPITLKAVSLDCLAYSDACSSDVTVASSLDAAGESFTTSIRSGTSTAIWQNYQMTGFANYSGLTDWITIATTTANNGGLSLSKIGLRISSAAASSGTTSSSSSSSSYLYTPSAGDKLSVYALEQTGQYGDATLFDYGNYEILIDGGNNASTGIVQAALKKYVIDGCLEMLILTHPHDDHYGGIQTTSVFTSNNVTSIGTIIDSGADAYSASSYVTNWVNGVRSYFVSNGTTYIPAANFFGSSPVRSPVYNITPNLTLTILNTGIYATPGSAGNSDGNMDSIVCKIQAGSNEFIMTGDLPTAAEAGLIANYPAATNSFIVPGDNVIFKAAHHASTTSNGTALLSYCDPDYCWVSAAILSTNSSASGVVSAQHPYKATRTRIENYVGAGRIFWNGTMGTIDMKLDASFAGFALTGEGRQLGIYYYNGAIVDAVSEQNLPIESTKWALSGF